MEGQQQEQSFLKGFKGGLGLIAALFFVFVLAPCAMCGGLAVLGNTVGESESTREMAAIEQEVDDVLSGRRPPTAEKEESDSPGASGESRPSPRGKWHVDVRTSEMDDSKTVVLALDSENRVENWLSQKKQARLLIRCQENRTSAYVNTGMQANPELGNYNKAHARIRLDQDEPKRVNMSESTDGEALFFPGSTRYPKMMEGKTKMLFEFTPFNQGNVRFEFDLTGIDEVLPQVKEACGWG
ncbi:hypothetical protein [Lujinxingia vulgaris]|nr:hypothetical protein [Lujinxingia vulgaris]